MRITELDLQCEDIMWFGIDSQNHIFECTSAGCGNVPEFVCKSKENTELLAYFFTEELNEFTQARIIKEYDELNPLIELCILLSRKGIFCFDISEENTNQYVKLTEPVQPLTYDELPQRIKDIFYNNKVNTDVDNETFLTVPHAYE